MLVEIERKVLREISLFFHKLEAAGLSLPKEIDADDGSGAWFDLTAVLFKSYGTKLKLEEKENKNV